MTAGTNHTASSIPATHRLTTRVRDLARRVYHRLRRIEHQLHDAAAAQLQRRGLAERYCAPLAGLQGENPPRVLFLCTGNICRSAYAAARLKALVSSEVAVISSAGLITHEGKGADPLSIEAADRRGVCLKEHRTTPSSRGLLEQAHLILAMEPWQLRAVLREVPAARGRVMYLGALNLARGGRLVIADPYGKDEATFDQCFDEIDQALETLAHQLNELER